ncbi:MAG: MFS transporter, partial [Clostridia bacterium]|nr:MFS transporter [Clostridia bacterium]
MKKQGKKVGAMANWKFWLVVWGMGIAGQLCWNMENQWFNTFVYAKIGQRVDIVNWMVILSAFVTTISTFVFGTMADRQGKRKKFVSIGYIIWGIATILFGTTEFIVKDHKTASAVAVAGVLVVLTDAVMSFFGSMGYDSGFNVWLNDHTDDNNKGQVGAALAALPIFGTIVGTLLGGALVDSGNPTAGTDTYDPSLGNYQL